MKLNLLARSGRRLPAWILPALLLTPCWALADDETAEAQTEGTTETRSDAEDRSDELASFFSSTTVTATGSEVPTFEISTPVTVLRRQDIERLAPESAADLLRLQPGVDVNGVGPNQTRPVIRGQRGLRVLFLQDGLRMNNARRQTDFGETPGLVDTESISSVEVVRGPASVLYGSDAIGGVLNLIPRVPGYRGAGGFAGSLLLRHRTTGDQWKGQATVDGRWSRTSLQLGLSTRDASDYEAPGGTFGDIRLAGDTPVVDSGVQDETFFGYLGRQLSDSQELYLRFQSYSADETGFGFVEPEALGVEEAFRIRILYPKQDFDRLTAGYMASALGAAVADSLDVRAYFQANDRQLANDIDIDIGPIFPGAPPSSLEADTLNTTALDTLGLRSQAIKVAGRHLVTYGLEYYRDDSQNTDFSETTTTLRFPFPPFELPMVTIDDVANTPNAVNESTGVFVQDEIDASERIRLTVGARFQNVATRAEPTPGWDIAGLDFDDDSVVGSASLVYAVSDNLRLAGSYGTAFRAPNIVERLFNGPTPEGAGFQILNPDLTSEESENVELAVKYLRPNAVFELVVFRNEIDKGIIGYRADNGFSVGANSTSLDGKRFDSTNPPTGDTVNEKLNLRLRWEPPLGRYWLEYRLRYNGEQPTNIAPNEPVPPVGETLPSFTVQALSAGVALPGSGRFEHDLALVIDNLTDELYAEFSNATFFRPQPARSTSVSYRVRF